MNSSSKKDPARLNGIAIVPSSAAHAEQMEELTGIVYGLNPREAEETFTADHFRQHLKVFPEGQFVAVDTRINRVVGLTACMRTAYDPLRPPLDSWWATIGYG